MNSNEIYISHSAIKDFLKCPSLYDLRYRYRNPKTGNKVDLVSPYLTLGSIFDGVRERLSLTTNQFIDPTYTLNLLNALWTQESLSFGFKDQSQEEEFKGRAVNILKRFITHSHFIFSRPFSKGFIKIGFGAYPNVFLCGSADWIEQNPDASLTLIDFKTGQKEESEDSLQLPIYKYLVENRFGFKVSKTFYWYLDWEDNPREVFLNAYEEAIAKFLSLAEKLLRSILEDKLKFAHGNCPYCEPYQKIKNGEAKFVTTSKLLKRDLFAI